MRKLAGILTIVMLASFLWMCTEEEEAGEMSLTGSAVKGAISNAEVEVYAFNEDDLRGELLTTATTNSDGQFNLTLDYRGGVEIVVSGGSYTDEASGETVSAEDVEFRNIILADGNKSVGVTALTTIAAKHIDEHASEGLAKAIENANGKVGEAFGLNGIDISSTVPADLSSKESVDAEQPELDYGAVQAGLSELMLSNELSPGDLPDLINDMAKDFSDGAFDGKSGDAALQFALDITPKQAMQGLNTAIDNFLNGPRNSSEYSPDTSSF